MHTAQLFFVLFLFLFYFYLFLFFEFFEFFLDFFFEFFLDFFLNFFLDFFLNFFGIFFEFFIQSDRACRSCVHEWKASHQNMKKRTLSLVLHWLMITNQKILQNSAQNRGPLFFANGNKKTMRIKIKILVTISRPNGSHPLSKLRKTLSNKSIYP